MVESEGEDNGRGPIEVFGIHRLELAPGTKSGYVGVRPSTSHKNPWQAWVSLKGEKRRNVGSFKTPRDAAVARAAAKACGAHLLRSPRKQAPRNKGAAACRLPPIAPSLPFHHTHLPSARLMNWTGKRSAEGAFTALSQSGLNETYPNLHLTSNGTSAPLSALPLRSSNFSSPYTSNGVQRGRPLLPGQPLPLGVAAVCMAVPVEQPVACGASGTGGRVPAA